MVQTNLSDTNGTSGTNGQVKITVDRSYLKLQIPSIYARLYYGKKQVYISFGAKDTPQSRLLAEQAKINLTKDLELEKFNPKNLTRYQHPNKQAKTGTVSYYAKNLTLSRLWIMYSEYVKPNIDHETYKDKYLGYVPNTIEKCNQDIYCQQEIRNKIVEIAAPTVALRCLRTINAALHWAKKEQLIPDNFDSRFAEYASEFAKTSKYKSARRKQPAIITLNRDASKIAWNKNEMEIIIDAYWNRMKNHLKASPYCKLDIYPYLIEFLFKSGLRHGEAFALTWDDIAKDYSKIYVTKSYTSHGRRIKDTKNGVHRAVPCSKKTQELLVELKEKLPILTSNPKNLVFPNFKGSYLNTKNFERTWGYKQKGRSEIPVVAKLVLIGKLPQYIDAYSTRRTFISLQLQAGYDVKTVADWVGDKPKTILKHYASRNENAIPVD